MSDKSKIQGVYALGSVSIDEFSHGFDFVKGEKNIMRSKDVRPLTEVTTWERPGVDPRHRNVATWGVKIDGNTLPKALVRSGSERPIADYHNFKDVGVVSEKFKALVEMLEPGVHQFFPVTLYWEGGGKVSEPYYFFNVAQALDSLNEIHSEAPPRERWFEEVYDKELIGSWKNYNDSTGGVYKRVFDAHSIGGACIWRDKYHIISGPWVSDKFHDASLEAGLSGLGFGAGMDEVI